MNDAVELRDDLAVFEALLPRDGLYSRRNSLDLLGDHSKADDRQNDEEERKPIPVHHPSLGGTNKRACRQILIEPHCGII